MDSIVDTYEDAIVNHHDSLNNVENFIKSRLAALDDHTDTYRPKRSLSPDPQSDSEPAPARSWDPPPNQPSRPSRSPPGTLRPLDPCSRSRLEQQQRPPHRPSSAGPLRLQQLLHVPLRQHTELVGQRDALPRIGQQNLRKMSYEQVTMCLMCAS
uniref:Uncharacterized protein n=1 Tax=Steinernema glaseri TaxID=37863 RepID=A0A1I7YSL3_9BILA